MNPPSTTGRTKVAFSGTTRITPPTLNWKPLQVCMRNKEEDFSQPLARNFLQLQQHAKNKKDLTSVQTLDVIVSGLIDLTQVLTERSKERAPAFSSGAYSIFTRLAESYNNPTLLKQAGLHYMMEWQMPEAALLHFERALKLGGAENALHSLIEVATIAVQKKSTPNTATTGAEVTASPMDKAKLTQIIKDTDKILITKSLRPSSHAALIARTQKISPGAEVPGEIKDSLKQADKEILNGNLTVAHDLLRHAEEYPVKKEVLWAAWTNLAKAYYDVGQYPEMEEAYSQAYRHDPQGGNSYFNLALAKSLNDKIDEAVELYRLAGKLDPNNPKIWCNLGVLQFQRDQFAEAEVAFRSAIESRPDYARAWDNLASVLAAQEKMDEAIQACCRAIELKPGYPEAYFKLSTIYFNRGDTVSLMDAASYLSYAVNYPPLSASANAMLSMIHSRLEQVDSAKASLQRAVESDPKCTLLPTVWTELESAIRGS